MYIIFCSSIKINILNEHNVFIFLLIEQKTSFKFLHEKTAQIWVTIKEINAIHITKSDFNLLNDNSYNIYHNMILYVVYSLPYMGVCSSPYSVINKQWGHDYDIFLLQKAIYHI